MEILYIASVCKLLNSVIIKGKCVNSLKIEYKFEISYLNKEYFYIIKKGACLSIK